MKGFFEKKKKKKQLEDLRKVCMVNKLVSQEKRRKKYLGKVLWKFTN